MKIEIINFSGIENYFKRKKLEDEIEKTEKTIEKQQNQLHSNMEYLSVLKRDLQQANKEKRRRKKK